MPINELVVGDEVLIKAGVESSNLDERTVFEKDVRGRIVFKRRERVTVDIPDYHRLRTYRIEDVERYADAAT